MQPRARSQSAMEYLMTYGWAILIIAVVLAALFELGVFSSGSLTGTSCIASSGFLCTSPTLNNDGIMSIIFGQEQFASGITITGLNCSASSATPSFFTTANLAFSTGETTSLNFVCPVSGYTLGTPFAGNLWIQYDYGSYSGLVSEVATVTAKISALSSTNPTSSPSILYVPITLTNSQSSNTPAPFQQMLTIDSASYSSYINSGWSNVEFTTGSGSQLQAWVESGASNSATDTVVWVNLPNGIPAGGSTTIYMDFMPSNVMSASGPTGEAPQLSSTYAEYDDGANVFSNYWNFAGTTLPSAFTTSGGITYTVNNGFSATASSVYPDYIATTATYSYPIVVEFYGNPYQSGATYEETGLFGSSQGIFIQGYGGTVRGQQDNGVGGSGTANLATSSTTGVWSVYAESSTTSGYSLNYGTIQTLSVYAPTYPLPILLIAGESGTFSNTYTVQWLRTRAYPPNGVMPSASFGSVV